MRVLPATIRRQLCIFNHLLTIHFTNLFWSQSTILIRDCFEKETSSMQIMWPGLLSRRFLSYELFGSFCAYFIIADVGMSNHQSG